MYPITEDLLTSKRNRPFLRDGRIIKELRGIVIHWTANDRIGADDKANRNYFNRTDRYCSAHYIIDDDSITKCIPEHELAYHVGCVLPNNSKSRSWKATDLGVGLGTWENGRWFNPNYTTIGIEVCVNKDGDFRETYKRLCFLVRDILDRNGLTWLDVYRHVDICHKPCPAFMLESKYWETFLLDIAYGTRDTNIAQEMYDTMREQKWDQVDVKRKIVLKDLI